MEKQEIIWHKIEDDEFPKKYGKYIVARKETGYYTGLEIGTIFTDVAEWEPIDNGIYFDCNNRHDMICADGGYFLNSDINDEESPIIIAWAELPKYKI